MADYCLNFGQFVFLSPLGSLGAAYIVHLRLIGELVVDFLFVLIELFLLHVMADALQANINWKSVFLKGAGQFQLKQQCITLIQS